MPTERNALCHVNGLTIFMYWTDDYHRWIETADHCSC